VGKDLLFRFDEPATPVLPSEARGLVTDLRAPAGATLPEVTSGATGFARELVAAAATGLAGVDVAPGDSLFARTLSVQAILRWDLDDQAAAAAPGVLVCRGKRGTATERVAYGLELRVVNAGARVGELRWFWEDLAGVRFDAPGGQFRLGRSSETMMLTAVRRWISSGEVAVRYFLGDQVLNEAVVSQGEIGGGTTGTLLFGGRVDDGADDWRDHLDGAIDELRVVGRELADEEVAATWQRIHVIQPRGEQLVADCLPPGMPVSDHPDSSVHRELRLIGQGVGFAAAQAENLRANLMPDRAYGSVLDRWQRMTGQVTRPTDEITTRRRRVAGHLARHAGVSPTGVRAALAELLACAPDQLDLRAFDNTIRDGFDALVPHRWRRGPEAEWTVGGGQLTVAIAGGTAAAFSDGWRTCMRGVDGPERAGGYGAQLYGKVDPVTLPDGAEAGLMFFDWPRRDALLLGVRRDGADYQVITQRILGGIADEALVWGVTSATAHWLHLYADPAITYTGQARDALVAHGARWSTTPAPTPADFDLAPPGDFSFAVGWAGMYARAWDGAPLAGDLEVAFDDVAMRAPHGVAPFHFFVVRDRDLPGDYDLAGANSVLRKLKHSNTNARAVTGPVTAGDPERGAGGPCGGI
jgi:hypothetical protein